MLQEILLSLSGHPSPLLQANPSTKSLSSSGITPSERQLLSTVAHLSHVHIKLIKSTARIADSHPSTICRATANGIKSIHLAAFQQHVLAVESSILKNDPDYVGAYNIVPLTAVVGQFRPWIRQMDWLWEISSLMMAKEQPLCTGASIMARLRQDLQSGYHDVSKAAHDLVIVAEKAWLQQMSAWVLYGRLPSTGGNDFFVQQTEDTEKTYHCEPSLLPPVVSPATSSSMLFIGKSLNHAHVQRQIGSGVGGLVHLTDGLAHLANLTFPLNTAALSRAITCIRLTLSENTLQRILPLNRVKDMLSLLREYFLLGKGEFAMALIQEANTTMHDRWKRADNLAHAKPDFLKNVHVKDGELAAAISRSWTVLASTANLHDDLDEQAEQARALLRLQTVKSKDDASILSRSGLDAASAQRISQTRFNNLLFSIPTILHVELSAPLDMVFSEPDLLLYSHLNAYLLSLRKAHVQLTSLWKATSLRRQHPASRGVSEHTVTLRTRWRDRSNFLRSSWTTVSAAIFFLGETEAFLQTEVVEGLWDGFRSWLEPELAEPRQSKPGAQPPSTQEESDFQEEEDLWLEDHTSQHISPTVTTQQKSNAPPDPQALAAAHSLYLRTLTHRLLLTQPTFTEPLYELLVHIDRLVTQFLRLHSLFDSLDLETDSGVIDAFVNLRAEEAEVKSQLKIEEERVKSSIRQVITALTALENDDTFMGQWEGEALSSNGGQDGTQGDDIAAAEVGMDDERSYVPARVGGIERLLMKLDFGSWFGTQNS